MNPSSTTIRTAAYYGKTVGPDDEDKVLFRLKPADGGYRIIFDDLRARTVTAQNLKELRCADSWSGRRMCLPSFRSRPGRRRQPGTDY